MAHYVGSGGAGRLPVLRLPLELGTAFQNAADKGFATVGVALGIVAAAAVVSNGLDWYLENLAGKAGPGIDVRVLPMLRRAGSVVIYGLGGLLILDLLSINISPLIAGLGLGGLAVALALQPTLANLFAGSYVMTEGVIAPGDYIELASGISGYVVDVSWRSTPAADLGQQPGGRAEFHFRRNHNHQLPTSRAGGERLPDLRRQLRQRLVRGGEGMPGSDGMNCWIQTPTP